MGEDRVKTLSALVAGPVFAICFVGCLLVPKYGTREFAADTIISLERMEKK